MAFAVRDYGMSAVQHVSSAIFHEPGLQAGEESLAALLDDDDDDYRELNELRDDAADDAAADAARALAARPGVSSFPRILGVRVCCALLPVASSQ